MKEFSGARVQFTSVDPETEESFRIALGDLKEDASAAIIQEIGAVLNDVVAGEIGQTRLTQTFDIV